MNKLLSRYGTEIVIWDGDVLAFIAAAAVERPFESADGHVQMRADRSEGETAIDNLVFRIKEDLGIHGLEHRFVLSGPGHINWRLGVDPEYKNNRSGKAKPMLLPSMRKYLVSRFSAVWTDTLEADDVIGITMTSRNWGNVLSVGRDKDFKSIPGLHYTIGQDAVEPISLSDADAFFYAQCLAGDMTDNIAGCLGIGMTRAKRIVETPVRLEPKQGTITRGKNKGQLITKWHEAPTDNMWECIVTHYEKAGLTEAEALKTARLVRILRKGEFEGGRVKLWEPF